MQAAIVHILQPLDLHPIVDHFTIALLFVGVGTDLVGSLIPSRAWIRYMALTLMILGAAAAGSSFATGGIEADRIWKGLGEPARAVLHRHAELAEFISITFAVLAVWRILIEATSFMAGSRPIYLIVAIVATGVLGYVGYLGGRLVYVYGGGTDVMAAQASAAAEASPAAAPSPTGAIPTVTVPTTTPAAAVSPAASASPSGSPSPASAPSAANM